MTGGAAFLRAQLDDLVMYLHGNSCSSCGNHSKYQVIARRTTLRFARNGAGIVGLPLSGGAKAIMRSLRRFDLPLLRRDCRVSSCHAYDEEHIDHQT